MKRPAVNKAFNKTTWVSLLVAAVIGGSATAILLNNSPNGQTNSPIANPTSINQVTQSPSAARAVDGELSIYWIEAKRNKLVAVPIAIKAKNNDEAISQAVNSLITEKPPESELYSAIPAKTKVLNVSVENQDIRIDLSREFTQGGGSASMQGRIIQVLYSATSLQPEAKVYLSVEGKSLKYIGGEGLEVPQPMTRKDFALEF